MAKQVFIAGDWGTSNLRLYLCQAGDDGQCIVLDSIAGPGISAATEEFESVFFDLAGGWIDANQNAPVLLSGMIGSSIGWREAPYLACPADPRGIAAASLSFECRNSRFSLLPGLQTTNPLGHPDVMRGEELQLLGWASQQAESAKIQQLIALPGTHNKWALMRDNCVHTFVTAYTGELYALLCEHGILIQARQSVNYDDAAFLEGVHAVQQDESSDLVHKLFSTRSHQLAGTLSNHAAASYLSGLIIASDIASACRIFRANDEAVDDVIIIGESELCERYTAACGVLGINASYSNNEDIAIAAFSQVYRALYPN